MVSCPGAGFASVPSPHTRVRLRNHMLRVPAIYLRHCICELIICARVYVSSVASLHSAQCFALASSASCILAIAIGAGSCNWRRQLQLQHSKAIAQEPTRKLCVAHVNDYSKRQELVWI